MKLAEPTSGESGLKLHKPDISCRGVQDGLCSVWQRFPVHHVPSQQQVSRHLPIVQMSLFVLWFCGSIERRVPPSANNRSLGQATVREGGGSGVTSHRVYTEESDQEMDLWLQVQPLYSRLQSVYLQLEVPALDWPGHKTVSLTVTPFRKSCRPADRSYRWVH